MLKVSTIATEPISFNAEWADNHHDISFHDNPALSNHLNHWFQTSEISILSKNWYCSFKKYQIISKVKWYLYFKHYHIISKLYLNFKSKNKCNQNKTFKFFSFWWIYSNIMDYDKNNEIIISLHCLYAVIWQEISYCISVDNFCLPIIIILYHGDSFS